MKRKRRSRQIEPAPPVDLSTWPSLDDDARRAIIERLRPVMRDVADGLGARTASERATALEAVGLASLLEAGWGLLCARPSREPELGRFL